jgi:hypothetical protein
MDTHATIEERLEMGFSTVFRARGLEGRQLGQPRHFYMGACEEKSSVGREPPFREDLSLKATIVRSCYQATTSEDTVGWKRLSVIL